LLMIPISNPKVLSFIGKILARSVVA